MEAGGMGKPSPSGKKKKERWLLTRKTWRYMADAGRRLIPEGHGQELPKIEAYFQEVCTKEPKFLLWRKQSYPGALGFRRNRRRKGKGGSCRDKTSSADEEDLVVSGSSSGAGTSIATSRTDLRRLREEFLFGKHDTGIGKHGAGASQARQDELMGTLQSYLYGHTLDTDALFDKLKQHLAEITSKRQPITVSEDCQVLEVLRRYYSRSTNRDKVISDLLTDRKKLEGLYFDLRKARGFQVRHRWTTYRERQRSGSDWENVEEETTGEESTVPSSPVVVEPEPVTTLGTQTRTILGWETIAEEVRKLKVKEAEAEKDPARAARRSSVDNDDVSPSVSDTIKRYLRMARKKSVDSDKADRFKRVNYDRNLRNIKGKGEPPISEDDGNDKGSQTDETWIEALRDVKIETIEYFDSPSSRSSLTEETISPTSPTSPTSKSFLSSGQSFLTSLLQGLQVDKHHHVPGGMQKSRSTTSVVQQGSRLVAKKIWKSRSKSSSRATPSATSAWTPQGQCRWTNLAGRTVTLVDTTLDQLTEIERRILQKVALAKLQALNLGVSIKLPQEPTSATAVVQKPKRKAYLLKRKAITTGIFDTSKSKEDKGRSENRTGGMVFGIPLGVCVENERASRASRESDVSPTVRKSGARGSFSSLIEAPLTDDKGSIESLSPTLSMPGLDDISLEGGSESNLSSPPSSGVPNLVSACLVHLQAHLNTLGIFRVSSSKKRVRQLREDFDVGKELRLEDEQCPHDVATLLKEYFRDLPDPLLCKDLYYAFIQTQRIRNRKLQHEAVQHLLQLLPVANRDTLLSLLSFLALVASNCDDHRDPDSGEWVSGNRMDSTNLATLFAPNILHAAQPNRGNELSQERMDERADAINVIRNLIDNYQSLFTVSSELIDEVYVHMMDSHPEALDQLLRRKDASTIDVDSTEEERKFWSREEMMHETAATGGPDQGNRPRRSDRGRERLSKKRRDEMAKKRGESRERRTESGSGDSRRPSDERTFSSSDSGRLSPQTTQSDGVITASLKIPVPHVTSLLQNLDDIPFIEDADRHHITLGMVKSHTGHDSGTSESGLGSTTSPPPPTSPTPPPDSWEPSTSPTAESPTRRYQTQRHTRLEGTHGYSRLQTERLTKSASSTAVISHISPSVPTSISSIGSDVLRSKTADIERMIRSANTASSMASSSKISLMSSSFSSIGSGVFRSKTSDIERMIRSSFYSSSSSSQSGSWSSRQQMSSASAESKRRLTETSPTSATRTLTDPPASRPVGVWKRRELISSQPKSPL